MLWAHRREPINIWNNTNYSSPTFQDIIAEIQRDTMSPEEPAAIKDEAAWEKAKSRFRQEGIEDGLEQGLEQGRRQQQAATAKIMLAEGLDVAIIAKATGLAPDEVEGLNL